MVTLDLVGAWKFETSVMKNIHGDPVNDPGAKGSGLLMYSASGYMAVQLSSPPTNTEKQEVSIDNLYVAYYGAYHFDLVTQQVTHHILGSNIQALLGISVKRQLIVHSAKRISLKLITPEKFITDQPIYRELFWELI